MKTPILVTCAALALTACSKKEETTVVTPTATETAMATETTAAMEPSTGSMAGKYEITGTDGKRMTQTVNADGSYVDVMDGKETKGKWRMDGTKSCFDADGDEAEVCYTTTAPAADGSFQAMGPDGKVAWTVRKVG